MRVAVFEKRYPVVELVHITSTPAIVSQAAL